MTVVFCNFRQQISKMTGMSIVDNYVEIGDFFLLFLQTGKNRHVRSFLQ